MVERFPSSIHNEFNILETDVETFEAFCFCWPVCLSLTRTVSLYLTKRYLLKKCFVKEIFCSVLANASPFL